MEREKFMLHRNRMIFHKTKLIKLNLVPRVSYNAPSFSQIFNLFSAGETQFFFHGDAKLQEYQILSMVANLHNSLTLNARYKNTNLQNIKVSHGCQILLKSFIVSLCKFKFYYFENYISKIPTCIYVNIFVQMKTFDIFWQGCQIYK